MTENVAIPRRRFQFRLRTLMIGVTLLAVVCSYAAHQAQLVHKRRTFLGDEVTKMCFALPMSDEETATSIGGVRRWMGDLGLKQIRFLPDATDKELGVGANSFQRQMSHV